MRSVEERIKWFLTHAPRNSEGVVAAGQCLHHTWEATDIPPAGAADANACVALVRQAGKLHTDRNPPLGAWPLWTSSNHGHAALTSGPGRIASVDVDGPASTGIVDLSYPEVMWGHTYAGWTDWYGQTFDVGKEEQVTPDEIKKVADQVVERIDYGKLADALLDTKIFGDDADKSLRDVTWRKSLRRGYLGHDERSEV